MQKTLIGPHAPSLAASGIDWLDLEREASVEITSEDAQHPIEQAFGRGGSGWKADGPGAQMIRLRFATPQPIERVRLHFVERVASRTQEFVLGYCSDDRERTAREIVRQQWTFSPEGSTEEIEDYRTHLPVVRMIVLVITPNISGLKDRATLAEIQVARQGSNFL